MFRCKLKIDGHERKLSLENGLSFGELGELLSKLSKCIETDGIKFTLIGIENSSYTPYADTEEIEGVEKFNEVHRHILNKDYEQLNENEQSYADYLNTTLFERGIYIQTSNDKNDEKVEVNSIKKKKISKKNYSLITTITGKIVSIVGKSEDNPYITAQTSQLADYKIYIKPEDERKLFKFYKEFNIRFRIKLKKDLSSDKFIECNLIDYTIPKHKNFKDALEKTQLEYGDIFANIQDSAKAIRDLRN